MSPALTSILSAALAPLAIGVAVLCLALGAAIVIERIRAAWRHRALARVAARIRVVLQDPAAGGLGPADRELVFSNLAELARLCEDGFVEPGAEVVRAQLLDAGALPRLEREAQTGRSTWKRVHALSVLGWLCADRSMELLGRLMWEPELDVAYAAAQALSRYRTRATYEMLAVGLEGDAIPRERLVALLEDAYVPEALTVLERQARSADPALRGWAAYLFGRSRDQAAQLPLARLACDPEPDVRASAADGLGRFGQVTRLRSLLDDEEWFVRARAAKAVGAAGRIELAGDLIPLLRDRSWWVRQDAAAAFAGLGTKAEAILRPLLDDDDRFARNKAAETLVRTGYVRRELERLEAEQPSVGTARQFVLELGRAEAPSAIGGEIARRPGSLSSSWLLSLLESVDEDWARSLVAEATTAGVA